MNKYKILKEFENNMILIQDILGTSATDNIQLNKIGKYLFGNLFIGVFPSDEIPEDAHRASTVSRLCREPELKNDQMCIINTDNKSGVHWIACYRYRNKTFVYDSFNRDVKSLSKQWRTMHNWVNANKDRDQSYSSSLCGQISICWLISAQTYTPPKIINII